jgi:hypothetical protein
MGMYHHWRDSSDITPKIAKNRGRAVPRYPIETFHINFAVSGAFWKYLVHDTFLLCMD